MIEWSEDKINTMFELSTLENPYIDSLFHLIYLFYIFLFSIFGVVCLIGPNWEDNSQSSVVGCDIRPRYGQYTVSKVKLSLKELKSECAFHWNMSGADKTF